jgi:superoxide dismutase, Cu-Zn family
MSRTYRDAESMRLTTIPAASSTDFTPPRERVSIMVALMIFAVAGTFPVAHAGPAHEFVSEASANLIVRVANLTEEGASGSVGKVRLTDTQHGLMVEPRLDGLSPGPHALHVHEHGDCGPTFSDNGDVVPGGAAGGHFDPAGAGRHEGPYGEGHLGDLPNVYVEADGAARIPVLAPRVTVADLRGRSLIVHAGADRYSDEPAGHGGAHAHHGSHGHSHHGHTHSHDGAPGHDHGDPRGGARMYCGIIPG